MLIRYNKIQNIRGTCKTT